MEILLKSFLSLLLMVTIACTPSNSAMTKEEKKALAAKKWKIITDQSIALRQGSPQSMNLLDEIIALDPSHCDAIRERSVPYLKRGIPYKWKEYMDQAVICDAKRWQGWRGYLYLFFYRDFKKAVADLNATDSLTPHFIDNPQGHSVDYWRGHAYLGMKDYKNSIFYYQKHIDKVVNDYGENWVEPDAFLNLGIAFFEHGMLDSVPALLNKALQYYDNKSADTKYYWALYEQSQGDREKALEWVHKAMEDFKLGHSKERPYNEEIRQVYFEELEELESLLK